jgi:hypothetical protein
MNIDRFALLLAASTLGHAAAAQTSDDALRARTYELSVVSADGYAFRDCAAFGADNDLVLQAAAGLDIDWLSESGDPSGGGFHAVTDGSRMASSDFGLALHGAFASSGAIRGNAINDRGLTFSFSGRLNRACELAALYYRESPYSAAPATPVLFEPAPASVAGNQYGVRLYGAGATDDCLRFEIDGTLIRNGSVRLAWGMDRLNEQAGTFQSVGSIPGGSAGVALHGQLTSWGELRVQGIASSSTGLQEVIGSGRRVAACIEE